MQNTENDRFEPLERDQDWDEELANELIGSNLFVGITYENQSGSVLRREQLFGTVESVSERAGIKLIQSDGTARVIAPVLDAIEPGDIDRYQLSEADEEVENPDFVAWITAMEPHKH